MFWDKSAAALVACLSLLAPLAAQPQASHPIALTEVLKAATNNWEVVFSEKEAEAAKADVVAANRAPLPILSAKTSSIDLQNGVGAGSLWQQKRIDKSVGLDWTWERADKRLLRTRTSEGLAQAAQTDVLDVQLQQKQMALEAFYDLLAAQERQQELVGLWQSYEQLLIATRKRLQAGDVSAQDLNRISIETERARAETESAYLARWHAAHQLALLMRQADPGQGLPQAMGSWPKTSTAMLSEPAFENALSAWLEQRPNVKAAQDRLEASKSALALAQAQKTSDITWGSSFDHFPGSSTRMLEFRLQMPLQWGYGYEGEIRRAAAQNEQAENQVAKALHTARHAFISLYQSWRATHSKMLIYEQTLLPKAQQVATQAELAYQQGALPLTDLLEARRTLRATRLEGLMAKLEHAKAQGLWQLNTNAL